MKQLKLRFLIILVLLLIITVSLPDDDTHAQSRTEQTPQHNQSDRITPDNSEPSLVLKTEKDKVNYAIGVNLIGTFKKQGIDIDLEMVMRGMRDASSGEKLLMTDSEIIKSIMLYQGEVQRMQAKQSAMAAESNRQKGEDFLAENKKKDGVVSLPSGLQYLVLKEGHGTKPTDSDSVECNYRGTHINGTEFDSSFRTGRPATFKVADVIPGWREALQLMPVGSKWQIFVPPQLAYGARGAKGSIEPNETLIFEMELLSIK